MAETDAPAYVPKVKVPEFQASAGGSEYDHLVDFAVFQGSAGGRALRLPRAEALRLAQWIMRWHAATQPRLDFNEERFGAGRSRS